MNPNTEKSVLKCATCLLDIPVYPRAKRWTRIRDKVALQLGERQDLASSMPSLPRKRNKLRKRTRSVGTQTPALSEVVSGLKLSLLEASKGRI